MKKVYSLLSIIFCCGLYFPTVGQPGVLDQTFGNSGQVRISVPSGDRVHPVDIKVQTDQKILVLVRADTGFSWNDKENFWKYQLLRFKPDGTPDSSFAVNGSTPVVNDERPTNMVLLANGQILLNTARFTAPWFLSNHALDTMTMCLTRYNANGSIDNTFGSNGRAVTRFDTSHIMPISVFVLPNGKMIQAGISFSGLPSNLFPAYNVMVGYDQNGNIDPTFGTNGKVKVRTKGYYGNYYSHTSSMKWTFPQTFLMLSNQKIVATSDSGLYRFNSNGSLDAAFGINGFRSYPSSYIAWGNPAISGLVEPGDKMVFVMRTAPFGSIPINQSPMVAYRFNADGSPDTTFQTFILDEDKSAYGANYNQCGKIFLEPNGQYGMATGIENCCLGNYPSTQIAKVNSDGSADSSYGKRGRIYTNDYLYSIKNRFGMRGNAAALQPDGKMVIGGVVDTFVNTVGTFQKAWIISRFEKNAKLKYNTLVGNVFHDENANGVKDANEGPFNGFYGITSAKPGIDTIHWWSRLLGNQPNLQDVDTGTYKSSVELYNRPYFTVSPAVITTSHSNYWNTDTLSFAVQQIANIRDLEVTAIQLSRAKPGFPIAYLLKVHNAGTDSAGNVVIKLVKSNKINYNSATVVPTSIVADTIRWNVGGIRSLHDAFITVYGTVKAPPTTSLGDILVSVATVSSDRTDTLTASDTSVIWQQVFGAFDPNDKTENHGGKISLSKATAGEYLTYTIRFQNTGNDTAFNVYIRDTMDSKLNWNSLQIVAASHNYKMTMNDGKCLFTFPMIKLVDSIRNEPKSHGYIVYKIKPKPNVQIGDVIKNTAAIYFDYNLPIFTNTEKTTVVSEAFPLKLLSFTAKKEDKTNRLQWSTTNEVNVDHFEIERSGNGREFVRMQNVKCKIQNGGSYGIIDYSPFEAINYYRLRIVDKDGSFEYSPIRMVNNSGSFYVSIYPNPAKDNLQVQIDSDKKKTLQMQVLSMDGKVILSKNATTTGSILHSANISALQNGSYILIVKSADKEESIVKFEKH